MQLFFNNSLTPESQEYTLPKDESKHIIRVLRKDVGDIIYLTNGKGHVFTAKISIANPNKCLLSIVSHTYQQPSLHALHLAVAPTKLNDRYEWFLEKATEIGITEITPILCENSERKVIKIERFQKILQSAMKQSLNAHLPKLNEFISLDDFIHKHPKNKNRFIAHCEEDQKTSLKNALLPGMDCTILIGPEGDFSRAEIDKAIKTGFCPVSLGQNRLRTETAAIVACHTFNFSNEKC